MDCSGYPIQAALYFLSLDLTVESSYLHMQQAADIGEIDIFGDVTLRTPQGIPCQIYFGFDNAYQCIYELHGSKGIIKVPKAYTPRPNFKPVIELQTDKSLLIECDQEDHFGSILQYFRSLIETNNGTDESTWQRTYHTVRIQEVLRKTSSSRNPLAKLSENTERFPFETYMKLENPIYVTRATVQPLDRYFDELSDV